MDISLGVIGHNESVLLPTFVKTYRAIPQVKEIIYIDSESEDGSADLAETLGCRVVRVPWERDFFYLRNCTISLNKYR